MKTVGPPPRSYPIELEARSPSRNIHRRYRIDLIPDLFGSFVVELHWGRIGAAGRSKQFTLGDRDAAERIVEATLRRRQSATRRIGASYEPIGTLVSSA